jgi:lipoprotein-anchoring transpeptidase ErfK/SrfK
MFRPIRFTVFLAVAACSATASSSRAVGAITPASIDAASPRDADHADPSLVAKAEVLLDRARFSPGEIDGHDGDNFRKAVRAFQQANGLPATGKLDTGTWSSLISKESTPPLKTYTIAEADVTGPFTKAIPTQLEALARLPGLSYTSPSAEIAEKFHMAQNLLRALNPNAGFRKAGETIVVADVPEMKLRSGRRAVEAIPPADDKGPIAATIVVDKPAGSVRAYDRDGNLLAFYPATMGSAEKPAPSGQFIVKGVGWNPEYQYDPKFAWKGVKARRGLTVRSGPNNPVGLVWIDLTAPSYGIHGTPAPENIGKTQSHGCIRLTNWDTSNLAAMARPGTVVRFDDQDSPVVPPAVLVGREQKPEPESQNLDATSPARGANGMNAIESAASMSASDYAECVSDLTSRRVVLEQPNTVKQDGCELSGAVRLLSVATPFGDVALSGSPTMLCSFGRQLSGWVRDVAGPLTLAYTGRKLTEIEIPSAFACRARYDN